MSSLQKRMKNERLKTADKKIELCITRRRQAASFPRTERNKETIQTLNQWEENWRSIYEFDFERTKVGPHVALRLLCEWLLTDGSIKLGTPQSKMLIETVKQLGA